MPFVSQAQQREMFANQPAAAPNNAKLPPRVKVQVDKKQIARNVMRQRAVG